jgi:hypothetical protein
LVVIVYASRDYLLIEKELIGNRKSIATHLIELYFDFRPLLVTLYLLLPPEVFSPDKTASSE